MPFCFNEDIDYKSVLRSTVCWSTLWLISDVLFGFKSKFWSNFVQFHFKKRLTIFRQCVWPNVFDRISCSFLSSNKLLSLFFCCSRLIYFRCCARFCFSTVFNYQFEYVLTISSTLCFNKEFEYFWNLPGHWVIKHPLFLTNVGQNICQTHWSGVFPK